MPGAPTVPSVLKGHAAEIWSAAFQGAYEGTCKKRKDRDSCAAAIAWSAVKNKYRKSAEGKWVQRELPPVNTGTTAGTSGKPQEAVDIPAELAAIFHKAYEEALKGDCLEEIHPEACAHDKAMAVIESTREAESAKESVVMADQMTERRKLGFYDAEDIAARVIQRSLETQADEAIQAQHGDRMAIRLEGYTSEEWRMLPPAERTVKAMVARRALDRSYEASVDQALCEGWYATPNLTRPEEMIFRRFVETPDGPILVRSILVRKAYGTDWYMRELSRGTALATTVRIDPDERRYAGKRCVTLPKTK